MAALPGWLQVVDERVVDGRYVIDLRVRRWHPGFWLAALRALVGR